MPSSLALHFESRAAELADCATLEVVERDGAVWMTLRPHADAAVGVVLYLAVHSTGTVNFDDRASAPAELGDDERHNLQAIDSFIVEAVDGRLTSYRTRRGGAIDVIDGDGQINTTYMNVLVPLPGWRRRWERVDYTPYREVVS